MKIQKIRSHSMNLYRIIRIKACILYMTWLPRAPLVINKEMLIYDKLITTDISVCEVTAGTRPRTRSTGSPTSPGGVPPSPTSTLLSSREPLPGKIFAKYLRFLAVIWSTSMNLNHLAMTVYLHPVLDSSVFLFSTKLSSQKSHNKERLPLWGCLTNDTECVIASLRGAEILMIIINTFLLSRTLQLVIENLPQLPGNFLCAFSALGKVLMTNATRTATGVSCTTPR